MGLYIYHITLSLYLICDQNSLILFLERPAKQAPQILLVLGFLATFFHNWCYKVVSSLICHVLQVLNLCLRMAENSRVCEVDVILFLLIKLVMLLLFEVIFVVVVLMLIMVTFWCL